MRVCSLVLVLLLASGTAAMAQNKGAGFKIGVNFAELNVDTGDVDFSLDRRTGLIAGIFYQLPIAPHVSIQPEFFYSQKGAKITEDGVEGTLKLDYFDVPVLLKYDSTTAGNSPFNLFAGPSFGFRHRARAKDALGLADEDIREDIERIDVGLVFGAGIEVRYFILDGRYQMGLSTVNKNDTADFKLKNRVFSILAGFRF